MVWRAASSTSNFSLKWYENYFHEICSDDSFVCVGEKSLSSQLAVFHNAQTVAHSSDRAH